MFVVSVSGEFFSTTLLVGGGDKSSFRWNFETAISKLIWLSSSFGDENNCCATDNLVGNSCRAPLRSTVLGVDDDVFGANRDNCKGLLLTIFDGPPGEVGNFSDEMRGGVFQRRLNPYKRSRYQFRELNDSNKEHLHEPAPCSWGQHMLVFPFQDSAGQSTDSV